MYLNPWKVYLCVLDALLPSVCRFSYQEQIPSAEERVLRTWGELQLKQIRESSRSPLFLMSRQPWCPCPFAFQYMILLTRMQFSSPQWAGVWGQSETLLPAGASYTVKWLSCDRSSPSPGLGLPCTAGRHNDRLC